MDEPMQQTGESGAQALSEAQFERLREALARYCGVFVDDGRRRLIEQALQGRLAALGRVAESYLRLVTTGGRDELQRLAELIVNHETCFFRNGAQFAALRNELLPALHRRKAAGEPLRLWSAGCASGEEAYSLAICALEALGSPLPRPLSIWGTDLSGVAVARGEAGHYGGRALANVAPELLARYFTPEAGGYRVSPALRRLVRFEQLNLLEPFPPAARGCEIIFCQNVTIYFRLDTCRELIGRFYDALPEGGLLFLGFSETLWQVDDRFRPLQIGSAFAYRKETNAAAPHAQPPAPLATVSEVVPLPPSSTTQLARARASADRGELAQALAEAGQAVAVAPLDADAHLLLGLLHSRLGQDALAVAEIEQARYLAGAAPLIRFHLAEAYRRLGRDGDARREYRNTLQALEAAGDDELHDGVTVGWLRAACHGYLAG